MKEFAGKKREKDNCRMAGGPAARGRSGGCPADRAAMGKGSDLLADAGSLAGALTQIVQLGTAHITAAGNLDGGD